MLIFKSLIIRGGGINFLGQIMVLEEGFCENDCFSILQNAELINLKTFWWLYFFLFPKKNRNQKYTDYYVRKQIIIVPSSDQDHCQNPGNFKWKVCLYMELAAFIGSPKLPALHLWKCLEEIVD